ncbi:hypothetical protein SKAU_G00203330 [Synaphobranchus kaupii]|uniref:Uncharacterized protein n=1 Tax=Synaphobranchus kaupii TaxID=118154 RepID=A0A9Q1FFY2_SYNKA|nr:hypothetical protein SKAU_G00203330 [Synaphobranchus kaupii]
MSCDVREMESPSEPQCGSKQHVFQAQGAGASHEDCGPFPAPLRSSYALQHTQGWEREPLRDSRAPAAPSESSTRRC